MLEVPVALPLLLPRRLTPALARRRRRYCYRRRRPFLINTAVAIAADAAIRSTITA